jgi:hypothetical protein
MVIDDLSMQVFHIQDKRERLNEEEARLRARIKELEVDLQEPIVGLPIVQVG